MDAGDNGQPQPDNCKLGFSRTERLNRDRYLQSYGHYGNSRQYIAARLKRDGFSRLASLVRAGDLSAQFAVELTKTVPPEHLEAVTDRAERAGPRRPPWWDWEFALSLPIND